MKTIEDIINGFQKRDKNAFVYKTGYRTFRISYHQLYENILKTVAFLEVHHIKKGDKILLWGYNSPQWGTIFLAAALQGVVIVPIDYMATAEFVEKLQQIVKAKAIFHSEFKVLSQSLLYKGDKKKVKAFVIEYLDIHTAPMQSYTPTKSDYEGVRENDLLEIVYTSGTTGNPKGVMLTHKNLITNLQSIKKVFSVFSAQTFLSLLPLSHLFEQNPGFLVPLSEGCTIIYIRGLKPSLIFNALMEERITNMIIVPRLLQLFADGIRREVLAKKQTRLFNILLRIPVSRIAKKILFYQVHKKFGMDFLYFISGGAPLSEELQMFWTQVGFTILQGYGLTECSPVLTATRFEGGSVGLPLPNIDIKVEKDGEIYAKGDTITQGYYQDPKTTKALFVNGWMRTGDLGFFDGQGRLHIKGRKKDVIISSAGIKVYPEDIEQILLKSPAVKDVCVVGLSTENGEEVHAEILLKNHDDRAFKGIKYLIDTANKELNQAQQIVSYGIWNEEDFPRTTTMKIKKHAVLNILKDNNRSSPANNSNTDSKLYQTIATVCHIDIMEVKPVAMLVTDLKLSSINRVELVSILEQEWNVDIDEEEITANTTVAQLQEMIISRQQLLKKQIFKRWLLWVPIRMLRVLWNVLISDNLIRIFCRRTVIGKDNLKDIHGPAIFISNHVGYFDTPNILMSLPFATRYKIAPAAWKEYFDIPPKQIGKRLLYNYYYFYASLMLNIYLFPKKKGFKKSLEYTGELLDKGWNILFFPEGEHSPTGELQSFRSGIGLLVKEMRVPVIPIKHAGLEKIMAGDDTQLPRFGNVTIKIGKPIIIDPTKSIPEITNELYNTIRKM